MIPSSTIVAGELMDPEPGTNVRVLVVDDTAFYRKVLRDVLSTIEGVEVVGTSSNGRLALQQAEVLRPDLMTLDLEMPEMNGIDVLKTLKRLSSPIRAIMVSSLTEVGANTTIEALQEGAFDFIVKPLAASSDEGSRLLREALVTRIAAFVQTSRLHRVPSVMMSKLKTLTPTSIAAISTSVAPDVPWTCEAVGIGISTGGPEALRQVIPLLPADLPVPVFIVQHMPAVFTKSLANSLDGVSVLKVVEAEHGMIARAGTVYIAPGGRQMGIACQAGRVAVQLTDDPPENSCQPAVDYLFRSMARVYRRNCLGVIMTGMGHDGSEGCRLLHRLGARIIAQDAATCVVFGMPRLPIQEGLTEEILPLPNIAGAIDRRARGVTPS
jgi:two-component system, chemotaxis family, protein-glutamate methylesterase/glutaminase